jgi:2-aminoethylphosphonate-pyruvate transaminase
MNFIENNFPVQKLFTPGPLTTSLTTRAASQYDLGSRDICFMDIVKNIRNELINIAHVCSPEFESIIIPGSGTYGIESVISSAIGNDNLLLNLVNGAYGRRISQISRIHKVPFIEALFNEDQFPDVKTVEHLLDENPAITHISMVHCETTTGILNPLEEISELACEKGITLIVDAMSSFGAYDIDLKQLSIGFIISSSNKCIEGIPGFCFVLAENKALDKCKGNARTLSLDLYDQWDKLNTTGQFRFTPPVQVLMAFNQALAELKNEGGIIARGKRYAANNAILLSRMKSLGFIPYLSKEKQSNIITSFRYPDHKNFNFNTFYTLLNKAGFVIYPGKLSTVDCFRIGNIGQIFSNDITDLVECVNDTLKIMNVSLANNNINPS